MAAQTLTAASNFDGPSLMLGLLNGEAITINGGALTIDSDVRWNQNAAVFGSITVSATLGGSVLFDGRNVWELPYTAATGNVPAQAALGSNGVTGGTSAATGELLRVWASGSLTPATAGGVMPATGWVKLRSKSGNFVGGEVVTLPGGATITISGTGKRGWLHMVGAEIGAFTFGRLADVKFRGEWYELGETNGADDQTFKFPVADACPAMWVEKTPGSYAADGEAGLEPWLSAGGRWGTATPFVAQDVRGKYFGHDLATGVITIAQRASNACGYKPASGLKVFVPNLILSNSTNANWSANTLNATMTTRYETAVTAGGAVDVQGVSANWFFNLVTPVSVSLLRSGFLERVVVNGTAKATLIEDFAVGLRSATAGQTALDLSNMYAGGTLRRVRVSRSVQGESLLATNCFGLRGTGVQPETFGIAGGVNRSATSIVCAQFASSGDIEIEGMSVVGARLRFSSSSDCVVNELQYADNLIGDTNGTAAMPGAIEVVGGSRGCDVYGFSNFGSLPNVHPFARILATSICSLVGLYDVGSPSDPYDFGTVNPGSGILNAGLTQGLTLRRVYTKNGSATFSGLSVSSSVQDVEFTNVWSDADEICYFSGTNVIAKGCRWTNSTTGQSSTYGRHWEDAFTSQTTGYILIACNEPTDSTAAQCSTSFAPGSGFTSAGSVSIATLGDYTEWTMPHFALGHTSLANSAPTITGSSVANHYLEFQADTGSGFSAWAQLNAFNLSSVGAINPATGVKLKVRATVTTANASNLLTYIRIDTVTDAVSQQIQYPLPGTQVTLSSDVPLTGAEIRVYDMDNLPSGSLGTELAGVESAGTTFSFDAILGNVVWLQVMLDGYKEYGQAYTIPAESTNLAIRLTEELNS